MKLVLKNLSFGWMGSRTFPIKHFALGASSLVAVRNDHRSAVGAAALPSDRSQPGRQASPQLASAIRSPRPVVAFSPDFPEVASGLKCLAAWERRQALLGLVELVPPNRMPGIRESFAIVLARFKVAV